MIEKLLLVPLSIERVAGVLWVSAWPAVVRSMGRLKIEGSRFEPAPFLSDSGLFRR